MAQRAHGPVDDAARQHGILAGLSLSLVETAGDLSHGIELLLKLHAQGKEVDPLPGFVGRGGRGKHHCVAIAHKRASVGLFSHPVDINSQGAAGQFHLVSLVHIVLHSAVNTACLFFSREQKTPKLLKNPCAARTCHTFFSGLGNFFCPRPNGLRYTTSGGSA